MKNAKDTLDPKTSVARKSVRKIGYVTERLAAKSDKSTDATGKKTKQKSVQIMFKDWASI